MIAFDEAVALIASSAKPIGSERLPLDRVAGRILAGAVVARIDSPRSDVSTMDGFAVREADLGHLPARLNIVGESFPGGGSDLAIAAGECVRIFTGAPVPAGCDMVVIQEIVRRDDDVAIIEQPPGESRFIRRRGSDFEQGEKLLAAGRRLDPGALVAAAAGDVDAVEVHRRPRVAIIATGDELVEPGKAAASSGAIPDSASLGVAALAEHWGAEIVGRVRVADRLSDLSAAAAEALQSSDLIVVIGGASVGERDFARTMFDPHGLDLIFSKLAIKPGKPAWFGTAASTPILGLPGNPTSAMVTARLLLAPLLCGFAGQDPADALRWQAAPLAGAIGPCGKRETFHRACRKDGAVEILSNQDSGMQKLLADAELLVRQRPDTAALAPGDTVEILAF